MIHLIGLALALLGVLAGAIVFVFNSQTPLQLGPIPFFASCGLFVAGGVMLLWRT